MADGLLCGCSTLPFSFFFFEATLLGKDLLGVLAGSLLLLFDLALLAQDLLELGFGRGGGKGFALFFN